MRKRSPRRGASATACGASRETRPVHGECGGYMVLGESLEDAAGHAHAMTGLLGHATSFAKRKLHLGYRTRGYCPTTCWDAEARSCAATNSTTRR